MYSASDLRKGLKVEIDGHPWLITNYTFTKPGKGQSIYKCRMRNMITGSGMERSFRSGDKVGKPNLFEKRMAFSYVDGENYVFMDLETYEETRMNEDALGDVKHFIVEDMEVNILFFNDTPVEVELPTFIVKPIARTEPGARGDTATNVVKPAWIDSGFEIAVPIFINEGDMVKIDTRTGEYVERVNLKK
jgi:elongation factor P